MSKPKSTYHFDYIIAGAGLAGLTLAHELINSPLANKKILFIDQSLTPNNDTTWGFWYRGFPAFQSFIHSSWDRVQVSTPEGLRTKLLAGYSYHSIKSGAFRQAIVDQLNEHPSVRLMEATIDTIGGDDSNAWLDTQRNRYTAPYIFQSCFSSQPNTNGEVRDPLMHHSAGWELTATKKVFDPIALTFMDFDQGFEEGIAFVNLLPSTSQKAFVEYIILSDQLKEPAFYHKKLELYLYNQFGLKAIDYTINQSPQGSHPVQNHSSPPWYAPRVLNIGYATGLTKPTTGHFFARIQRHCKAIVQQLTDDGTPALPQPSPFRYRMYDLWLMHLIEKNSREAVHILQQFFKQQSMDAIFQFFSEQNTLLEDRNIIQSMPPSPFLHAIWETKKELLRL